MVSYYAYICNLKFANQDNIIEWEEQYEAFVFAISNLKFNI